MASKSSCSYAERAYHSSNPVAHRLFNIVEEKKTNIAISADVRKTEDLLALADQLGPYIAVFKTHVDLVSDFSPATISGLQQLAEKHDFLLFEDRILIDIGNTVQQQYHGGALRISEFAHIVSASALAGPGVVEALAQTICDKDFPYRQDRALLIRAEMTTKSSLATREHTKQCIDVAREYRDVVIGFVAMRSLDDVKKGCEAVRSEDFVVFIPLVNSGARSDGLGEQYQTPTQAIARGADIIIVGRDIYGAEDPVAAVKLHQSEGWAAYLRRIYK